MPFAQNLTKEQRYINRFVIFKKPFGINAPKKNCQTISENIGDAKMGGCGSGRQGWKSRVEDCRSLDVNRLHKAGCLEPGYRGGWQWSRDGEEIAGIRFWCEAFRLVLSFRFRRYGEDWQDVEQPVGLIRVPCHLGGQRPYFRCPGVVNGRYCGRRVAKLYSGGPYFLCRHCYDLTYVSRSERGEDRFLRRANKRRMALGGEPGPAYPIAEKPKGMHWKTYWKLVDEIEDAEARADREFLIRLEPVGLTEG